ncbi:hypothetical protein ABE28_009175 [Peribacillus muralis]|uniref:Uncharacterized protein n=1 Tax=Peribacillus muralis TaxID=264697 RepID=A0A1B3XMS5_9BACI|nr:hypothetical protein [Peribacillus muralis]AOH54522.1 hypothetical protein ABE28_009175 [Peribacillus muralis]
MNYFELTQAIGSVATAGAFIWAFISHRLDSKRYDNQLEEERRKHLQDRSDIEISQIESKITNLNETMNNYAGILLTSEKLKWSLKRMSENIEQNKNSFVISDYEPHLEEMRQLLNHLLPWQQSIIGDLPIDPLINNFYAYYKYSSKEELLEWVENFELQVEQAAEICGDTIERISNIIENLQNKLMSF